MDLYETLCLPRKMRLSRFDRPARQFAPCHHFTQPWQCDSQKTRSTTRLSAASATQNEDGHSHSAAPATRDARYLLKTLHKYCACHTKRFPTLLQTRKNVTKCHACHANYITTCFDAFEKESLCRFPHRHGDGRRKPEHQDETCWSLEHFVRDCLIFSHFVASKSAFSYEFSHEPRNLLPQNQFSSCVTKHHAAIRKKHATRHVRSAAPATKNASSENDTKIYCPCHRKKTNFDTLWNMLECQSTTPATWNEATRRLKPPKVTAFAELARGTAIATSLSMVADDCRRLRSQKRRRASTSPPQTPKVKREPFATHSGKNFGWEWLFSIHCKKSKGLNHPSKIGYANSEHWFASIRQIHLSASTPS